MDSVISFMDFLFPGFFILILKEYFELFLENRFSKKWIPYVFFCMYWLEDYIISNSIVLGVPYSLFFTIFNLFLLCKLIYKDSIKNILFSVFLIECLGCISEMLISIFLNKTISDKFVGVICSKILLLIFIRIIKLMKKQTNYEYISLRDWIINILISLSSIYIIYSF